MVDTPSDDHPMVFAHGYGFDPSYGYSLRDLSHVDWPPGPQDFEAFWQQRYRSAMTVDPAPTLRQGTPEHMAYRVYDINYRSTNAFTIGGWLLLPREGIVTRGVVIGHGYGGRDAPDFQLSLPGAALLFPCFRGLSRSAHPLISQDPNWHVLHNIHQRDNYILGGCVEDLWLGVSALLALYPWLDGHIAYLGTSFGGGIGALAMPWDKRIHRGHLNVPTFGHHPLRLTLHTQGSGEAVMHFQQQHGTAMKTLQYYDAATASQFLDIPIHVAAARFDPVVPPPGQFAIFNAIPGRKTLFLLDAGHFEYPHQTEQTNQLIKEINNFLGDL